MAQQIKKKFIQNDAVDSTKIKLLKDQAVRGQKQDGSEVELLKLDGSDKLVHDGQEIAFKSQVDAEAVAREQGDEQVQDNLDSEVSRLEGLISSEESSRMSEDSRIEGLLSSEEAARIAGDNSLQSSLNSEVSTRQSEISRVEGLLSDEEASRIAGDESLQTQINTEKSRVDAILLASEADKDSFAEIVELINSVDTENDSAFASYVLSNNAALAQEVSDRQQGDSDLQDNIDAEESRAMGEESRIESKFDGMMSTETAARIAGDADLQSQVDAEESRAMGEESRIESKFDGMMSTETAARIAADSQLQSNIDAEASARQAADSAEQSRAMGVESSLQSQITQEVSDRQSAVSAEASARQSADQTLQSNIDAEETRAMGVEAELQSDLDNLDGYAQDIRSDLDQEILDRQSAVSAEETARIAGDSALQSSLNSEISARQSADSSLQSQITQEISDRQSAISSEESARIAGDASTLQSSKDYTDGKISLVMSNLDTEALDSLVEVVNAFQNADSDLNQTISDLSAAATSALAAEQAARIAADSDLQSQIDSEESRAMGVEAGLQSEIDALEGVVQGNFDLQQSDIDGLRSDVDALTTSLSDETSAREAADQALENNKVAKAGDTMTGELVVSNTESFITIRPTGEIFFESDMNDEIREVSIGGNGTISYDLQSSDGTYSEGFEISAGSFSAESSNTLMFNGEPLQQTQQFNLNMQGLSVSSNTNSPIAVSLFSGVQDGGEKSVQLSTSLDGPGLMLQQNTAEGDQFTSSLAARYLEIINAEGSSYLSSSSLLVENNASSTYVEFESGMMKLVDYSVSPDQPLMPTQDNHVVVKKYVDDADSALDARIQALEIQTDGPHFEKQKFVIDESSELSSIELSHECMENSLVVCVGRLMVHKDEDYSVSVVDGKSVLTWMGDFASGGVEAIEEGDVIFVTFARSV